jgi:ribosomal peptide maturation radical SAM protein 1
MNIVLVNMPFGAIRPAIGPSLLKAHLSAIGCQVRIAYLNLRFAEKLGASDFSYIADRSPTQSLAGDWVFSPCLFGVREAADREYLAAFRERFEKFGSCDAPIAILRRARGMAEDFIAECLACLPWECYDLIGFTSTFTQNVASLALARRIKDRFPGPAIVFGGANCEGEMGLALHRMFPFVDYVCSGEADLSLPRLVSALDGAGSPDAIPGVISRRSGVTVCPSLVPERVKDLDTLPYPEFDDYFEQLSGTGQGGASILMESSRGCWWGEKHHCTFCGLNGTAMAYRSKSADRVLDEITAQTSRYGATHIEMVDNILDMHYFRDLLPELKRRRLRLGLFYETKANLTKDQVRLMCDAGITAIQPGIESFSTNVLRIMRKGTTGLQNIQVLKWCKELGLETHWNLLYGFPGEAPADYAMTAEIIDSISHLDPPEGVGPIRLDRFSPNFVSAAALGFCNLRPDRSYRYIYDHPSDDLFDLAYYFEYDYLDHPPPEEYIGPTESAMQRWFEQSRARGLAYADLGDRLAIWDFRPVAIERLTVLEGHDRHLYLHCDTQHSEQALLDYAKARSMPESRLRRTLARLVATRLMIALDGRYLSLAIAAPTAPQTPRPPALTF